MIAGVIESRAKDVYTRPGARQMVLDYLGALAQARGRPIAREERSHEQIRDEDRIAGERAAEREAQQEALREQRRLVEEGRAHQAEQDATLAALRTRFAELQRDAEVQGQAQREQEQRVEELNARVRQLQGQILQAYQRIRSDDGLVSRAKKALSIALTLLDESGAPIAVPEESDEAAARSQS